MTHVTDIAYVPYKDEEHFFFKTGNELWPLGTDVKLQQILCGQWGLNI